MDDRQGGHERCHSDFGHGFEAEFVKLVITQIRRNQFKRMLPIIAKLSNRTIGYDFLYMRDWGT